MQKTLLLGMMVILTACSNPEPHGYRVTKSTPVEGDGGWDYVAVDSAARRVYVTHSTKTDVLDADTGDVVGTVAPLAGAHGTAIAAGLGYGFATNGKANNVTVFDLKTLAIKTTIATGKKPDAIVYDPSTKRVLAFNGDNKSATVIDAVHLHAIGTIPLKGGPEFAVADGRGHVFVNLEDESEMLVIDTKRMKVIKHWALAPCTEPASLAMDRANGRLFAGCGNHLLAIVDAKTGHVITTQPIGEHVDATAFDAITHEVIASGADGTLTIITQDDADHYHVTQTVTTPARSKTFGLDEKKHRLFVPSATFGAAPTPSPENPKARPPVLPGTFNVLMVDRGEGSTSD